mgnify:CR=1 FL=1
MSAGVPTTSMIEVVDDGTVTISSHEAEAAEAAMSKVEALTADEEAEVSG